MTDKSLWNPRGRITTGSRERPLPGSSCASSGLWRGPLKAPWALGSFHSLATMSPWKSRLVGKGSPWPGLAGIPVRPQWAALVCWPCLLLSRLQESERSFLIFAELELFIQAFSNLSPFQGVRFLPAIFTFPRSMCIFSKILSICSSFLVSSLCDA